MAVVKGVPAAAFAYHNPSGALVDSAKIASSEKAMPDFCQGGTAADRTTDGGGGVDGDTASVDGRGDSGGDGGDDDGSSIGTGPSRFRCSLDTKLLN